jgi:hypothetical protein
MELEKYKKFLFLMALLGSSLMAYWVILHIEDQHMHQYLHAESQDHPAQKSIILLILVHQARTICNMGSLETEI